MKISIIIPTVNRNSLDTVIGSLKGQDFDEIIIVNDKLSCASNARNRGITMASGDIIVFIDDDVVCDKDFILQGKAFFERYTKTDLMQGCITGKITTDETHMFITANLWVRKELAKKLLFCEKFKKTGREDLDFGWRAMDIEANIRYNSLCVVNHPGKTGTIYTDEVDNLIAERHPQKWKKLKEENNSWI